MPSKSLNAKSMAATTAGDHTPSEVAIDEKLMGLEAVESAGHRYTPSLCPAGHHMIQIQLRSEPVKQHFRCGSLMRDAVYGDKFSWCPRMATTLVGRPAVVSALALGGPDAALDVLWEQTGGTAFGPYAMNEDDFEAWSPEVRRARMR